jgi:phenylpyruvate tautomerase PptA (4-oxalocrotonate tautomerase family)
MPVGVAACLERKHMPVLNFHLVQGQHPAARIDTLLLRSSQFFAEVLACPIDRVRVFVTEHAAQHACVGGQLVSQSGQVAPYFTFIVLQGRSLADRQRLLAGFTDLVVEILACPRELVRGGVTPVATEDWSIGGVPASHLRQAEIEARQLAAAQ